jgi:hypothetical protein
VREAGFCISLCGSHMDDNFATIASQIKFRILVGKPGELRLEDGFIAFTSSDGSLVFRAPLQDVRTSFPKVTFFGPFPLFGTGINLAVGGNTYRLFFVPFEYQRWGSVPGSGAIGPTWSFSWRGLKQGRAAVRQWRATFGQRTGLSSRWDALAMAGPLLAVLVPGAIIVAVVFLHSSSTNQLTAYQLRPGDCLTGSNMGLGNSNPWPDYVTAVPCTQRHLAEVFFAGDVWPQSLAYPGDNSIASQADARCSTAFIAYDGIPSNQSVFTYTTVTPDNNNWSSGDRSLQCVAYDPNGASMNYSIKGTRR